MVQSLVHNAATIVVFHLISSHQLSITDVSGPAPCDMAQKIDRHKFQNILFYQPSEE